MVEKEFISKIQELKQIKPSKEWVVFTKNKILQNEQVEVKESILNILPKFNPIKLPLAKLFNRVNFRWALMPSLAFCLAAAVFALAFAQFSLPGDMSYPIKKAAEKTQAVFITKKDKPVFKLRIVNKRLKELTKIVEEDEQGEAQEEKVAAVIDALETAFAQMPEQLKQVKEPEKIAEVVEHAKKIKQVQEELEQTLAVKIFSEEAEQDLEEALVSLYKLQAENLLKDMESRSLTEEQAQDLEQAKELAEQGLYEQVLEELLKMSYSQF